jgi:hypothetical protein
MVGEKMGGFILRGLHVFLSWNAKIGAIFGAVPEPNQ